MKLEPIEHKWLYPEMQELFDKLASLRDDVWAQCRAELGDDPPPESATAAEIASRHIVRDDRRRDEIIESYNVIARGYERKMAELVMWYTVPTMLATKAEKRD